MRCIMSLHAHNLFVDKVVVFRLEVATLNYKYLMTN